MTRFRLGSRRRLFPRRYTVQLGLLVALVSCGWMVASALHETRAQDASSPCADTLATAEEAYRNRNYQEAVTLASQCTDPEAGDEDVAIRAHRMIALASLRNGALVQARSAVTSILEIDPAYMADPVNDPPSYDLFVSMVRQTVSPERPAEETAEEQEAEGPDERSSPSPEPRRRSHGFFIKLLGIGLSDYTGDLPIQNVGHPLDMQEFTRGSGFPVLFSFELGYQSSPKLAFLLGFQAGNYPIVGYNTGAENITDSRRYTPQLLSRYTFGTPGESASFYLDGGVNLTFGGQGLAKTGYGLSVGWGLDLPVHHSLALYVESRFNVTLPDDAIDGTSYPDDAVQGSNPKDGITGPFDSVNQLLGIGLRYRFGGSATDRP